MRRFIVFILFIALLFYTGIAKAGINSQIKEMLSEGQRLALYKDKDVGRSVISIGFGRNDNNNIAIDMAKHEALKHLTAFLKGEKISATESTEQKYIGDLIEESYYQQIKSSIEASVKSAYFYKSGKYKGDIYAVVIISERSTFATDLFNSKQDTNTVVAKGFASIDNDKTKARNNALNQALRNAVEQFNGVQMASKTSIENSDLYKAKLASVSKGYVKRYEIKNEYQDGENYLVEILAEISEGDPDSTNSIDAVKESIGRPSFYLNIEDKRLKDMISEVLSNNNLDITQIKTRAKYIISGEVGKYEYDVPSSQKMKGIQTTIMLKVSEKFSDEDIINISNDPENSVEISALKELRERNSYNYAMEELEEKLIKQINRNFVSKFNNGAKVLVKLVKFDFMRDVHELKECIESLPLTKSVSVSPVENKTVTYELLYLGNPSDLQLEIFKKSREYRLRGLKVKNNEDGHIWFTF